MARNGAADTVAERDSEGSAGERRLESELDMVRTEFEGLVAETSAEAENGPGGWAEHGRELLDQAEAALRSGRIEQGWAYLHAAKRLSIEGLEAAEGASALRGEARELLVRAENAPLSWRMAAIKRRLTDDDGSLREDLGAADLRSGYELLHEGYEGAHRKRRHLQTQFWYLWIGALLSIALFLVIAIGGTTAGLLPSPFFEFESGGASGSAPQVPASVLVYVVLSGMLGGALFGLWSLRRQPVSASTPQYLTGAQAAAARIVVGAGSALAVFFFVRAELLTIGSESSLYRGPFLIAVGFVAGYSQRLVHSTIESVAVVSDSGSSGGNES
jgi:hypothetical protein